MNFSDMLQKLNNIDLNDIQFDNIGSWPLGFKIAVYVVTFIAVFWFGYQFHLTNLQQQYQAAVSEEQGLREQYRIQSVQSADLQEYRDQIAYMKQALGNLVKQLPSDTEVPGLLEDITYTGESAGLQIEEIKLREEKANNFYIELPISIGVRGNYHDLGNFVSGVASLSRIVTLHDFDINPAKNGKLTMRILAKTYRYNDQEEVQ